MLQQLQLHSLVPASSHSYELYTVSVRHTTPELQPRQKVGAGKESRKLEPMEDLYSNQEARLRFEAYRYSPYTCHAALDCQQTH